MVLSAIVSVPTAEGAGRGDAEVGVALVHVARGGDLGLELVAQARRELALLVGEGVDEGDGQGVGDGVDVEGGFVECEVARAVGEVVDGGVDLERALRRLPERRAGLRRRRRRAWRRRARPS